MQEIQTYFISAFLGCGVQVISLMMGIQILTRGAFTKINLVILYIVLIIESMTLLYYIQYFSLIFTLGILVLALRLKKIRWTLAIGLPFVCVAYLVAVDYIVNITTILVFSSTSQATIANPNIYYMVYILALLVAYLLYKLTARIIFNSKIKEISNANKKWLIVVLILTMIMVYLFIYLESSYGFPNELVYINGALFFIYFLSAIIIFLLILKASERQAEIRNQDLKMQQLKKYTASIEKIYDEMNVFRHDYINILASLNGYIEKANQQDLQMYFEKTIKPLSDHITNKETGGTEE